MNFTEAQLLGYSSRNNFLSDGEFRYGSTKLLSIDSYIDTRISNSDASGVKESQEAIMKLVSGAHDFQEIIINNYDFGSGRIISIDAQSSPSWDLNQIRIGKHLFEIEISDSGENNLYNMTGNFLGGLKEKFSKHHLLESFGEDFKFTLTDSSEYSYDHVVQAKYFSGAEVTDPIQEARELASGIFEQDPSFGFLNSQRSGFYNADGKKYYKESYNLQTNDCSFEKHFECKPRYEEFAILFCSNLTHSIASDDNGIITISEKGDIMGLDDDGGDRLYTSALDGLNELINSSFNRCTGVFSGYSGFYGGSIDNLNTEYMSLSKSIDKLSSNLSYEIIYNNNSNISGATGQHSFLLELDSSEGVRMVTENGTIKSFLSKGEQDPVSLYNQFDMDDASATRCGLFYSGAVDNKKSELNIWQTDRFNLTNSTLSYSVSGNNVSYTKMFTDDSTIIKTNKISKMDVTTSDRFKTNNNTVYFIPNQSKEILHKRPTTTLASRTVSATCIYERPSTNFWTDISYAPVAPESNSDFYGALLFVKNRMIERALEDGWITILDQESMFISDFSYQIGSDNSLSATMEITYEEHD
jgi:hypothetical protein